MCIDLSAALSRFSYLFYFLFFFNDSATTEIYTLSLHDALPICAPPGEHRQPAKQPPVGLLQQLVAPVDRRPQSPLDRKSTRLNSSHLGISYAVFCLKKKKKKKITKEHVKSHHNQNYTTPKPSTH